MRCSRALSGAVLGLWLVASSCTSLREISRADYSAVPERKGVRVETRDGLVYDFDYAAFTGDSLTGYRHRADIEGPDDQTATFRIALDNIDRPTTREPDWNRTRLVGGSMLAGVLVAGLSGQAHPGDPGGNGSGGGGGGRNGN